MMRKKFGKLKRNNLTGYGGCEMNVRHWVHYGSSLATVLFLWLVPLSGFAEKDPYKIISEKNLFRPDRSEWVIEKTDSDLPQKEVDPDKLELFGTIIIGAKKSALIYNEKPREKGKRARKTRSSRGRKRGETELYSLGDYIGGYIVAEIEEKRVVLDYFGETLTLNLQDGKEPTKGDVTPLDVKKPIPKRKPKTKPKGTAKKQSVSAWRQKKAIEKKLASGKIPEELANNPFMSKENLKKLLEFNKEVMSELKESGGTLDQAAIKEKVEIFKERFMSRMEAM